MPNILTDLKQKIIIDYQEFRGAMIARWNIARDNRLIHRAVARARMKNKNDGRTYYVVKDRIGGINELNREQFSFFVKRGLFSREDYERRLERSIAIITSNKVEFNQYQQTQNKKEADNE